MKFFVSFALALVLGASIPAGATEARFTEIEQQIKTQRLAWKSPGMSVALVEHDQIVWIGSDGVSDLENQVAATADTMWRIASVSKPIAATAIMQLVEEGKVKLDEPIWTYIPWYPRKESNIITVRHILTHTSGIRHYNYEGGEKESATYYPSVEAGSHVNGVDQEPLQFAPGAKYLYSTYAYLLLAGIVEKASGLTYEGYVTQHIFGPAGMKTACFDRSRPIVPHRAHFYRKTDSGAEVVNAPYVDVSYKWAAGGVLATVQDLARYAIALDQGKLLKPETLTQVYAPTKLSDGTLSNYGLGWFLETDKSGRQWVYHSGGATGGAAFVFRCPAEGLAVVILCNLERPGELKKFAQQLAATMTHAL